MRLHHAVSKSVNAGPGRRSVGALIRSRNKGKEEALQRGAREDQGSSGPEDALRMRQWTSRARQHTVLHPAATDERAGLSGGA